jgi:hypothetical protein
MNERDVLNNSAIPAKCTLQIPHSEDCLLILLTVLDDGRGGIRRK